MQRTPYIFIHYRETNMNEQDWAQPYIQKKSRKKIYIIVALAVIFPILLTGGIIAVVFGVVFFGTKSVEEYQCAISEVKKDEKAIELLGEPMEEGFYIIPNIEISGPRREVHFSTPLSGPKASGSLLVTSYRDAFRSDFLMTLEIDGDGTILYKGAYPCQGDQ